MHGFIDGNDVALAFVILGLAWLIVNPRGCAQQAETPTVAPIAATPKTHLWEGFFDEGGGNL